MFDVQISQLSDSFGMGIWFYEKDEVSGTIRILRPIEFKWEEHKSGTRLPAPTIDTDTHSVRPFLEKFIERLKEAGYGRDKVSVESGELKAMREHLADMKKLVFTPPPHFAPMFMGNTTSGFSMLGPITPGRAWYSTPADLKISVNRVLKAAKTCSQATVVLRELFPEVFGPGWERFKDETD